MRVAIRVTAFSPAFFFCFSGGSSHLPERFTVGSVSGERSAFFLNVRQDRDFTDLGVEFAGLRFGRIPRMNRRTLLQGIPAVALLPRVVWAAGVPTTENAEALGARGEAIEGSSGVYELRVYHAVPGRLGDLLARFRDHTIQLFDRHGIKSVAYWRPMDDPEKNKTLIYILYHPSREAAETNWKSFRDDPEWKTVKEKSEANGALVEKIDSTFMVLTDFSPRVFSH